MGRYPPPGYEADANASPAYDEEGDAPEYGDQRYVSEDPYAQRHEEAQETDDSLAAMHQRELDSQRQGGQDDEAEEEEEDWLNEDADPEDVRRQNAERESGYEREREAVDEAYGVDESEEREREDDDNDDDDDDDEDN